MKKILSAFFLTSALLMYAGSLWAWEANGAIPGTDIEFSNLEVSKKGVAVRLANTSSDDVKVSLKLTFYDRNGNALGYSLFGLREIPAGAYSDISGNYLNGKWKPCRDSQRIEFAKMTYEPIYYREDPQ